MAVVLVAGMLFGALLIGLGGSTGTASIGSSAGSPSSMISSAAGLSKVPGAFPPIPVHRLGLRGPDTVNPTGFYSAEPAPMGIGDFGVGADGQAYTYSTPEFLGNFSWKSLDIQSNSSTSFTDQLNVVLQFVNHGVTYAYWIQDVAFMDSATKQLSYENNIWNFSSTSACLDNTGVSGNGTVYAYSGCIGYYAVAPTTQPGADLTMSTPGDFALLVRSYENARGVPEVAFEYWDGVTSWFVTYDNVVWPWATSVTSDNNFVVDGTEYNPYGLFYDAELAIGGPGGGASTSAQSPTDISSRLLYWNGHNFEAPPSVWNFGSNTGESVSNVQSIFSSDSAGLPLTVQLNGTARNATPAKAYDQNRVGELSISAPGIAAGTVAIPGDTWRFVNDSAELTLVPGTYDVWVNSTSGNNYLGSCEITAGSTLDVTVGSSCGSGTGTPSVSTPTASSGGADVGQSVTFSSTLVSAGSGGDTYVWNTAPAGLGCTASTSLTLSCTPTAAGTYRINITVTDSDGHASTSGTLTFAVASDPTVAAPTANKSSVETGENVTFTASPTGGAAPYTYTWSGLPTPCTQTASATPVCTPSSAGTYSISVSVRDSNGYSVASSSLSYTVLHGPSVTVPSSSPGSVDLGQSVTFSTTASGGAGSYTYSWSGLPAGCSSSSSAEIACTPLAAGSFRITVTVTDADGGSATSGSLSFTVNTDPTVGKPVAAPPAIDLGDSVTFSATASGGTGTFTYSWSGLPTGCSASSSAQISCTPTAAGSFSITVSVVDTDGVTASSGTLSFTVDPALVAGTLASSSPTVDVGEAFVFTVSGVTGGAAPYTYTWSGLPAGCSSQDTASLTCSPSAAGSGTVTVVVTDANGGSASSSTSFQVLTAPSLSGVSVSRESADAGQNVTFSVDGVKGGTGSYVYHWTGLPAGCTSANSATVVCVPTDPGSSTATVTVTDSNGMSVEGSIAFTVYADPTVGTPTGTPTSARVGQSVVFSVSVTGGSGSLTYVWSGLPAGCLSVNASAVTCQPSVSETTEVTVQVTDSNGVSARSGALDFTVSGTATQQSSAASAFTGDFLLGALVALAAVFVGLLVGESLRVRGRP